MWPCACVFSFFFLINGHHFVSSIKEKPTINIPVGQSDLKTAKSVFLSLRPSKLSKLRRCWTTAEERTAPPHTAAYEVKLIAEIFRKPVRFKGAVETGSFHSRCAGRSELPVLLGFCRVLASLLVKTALRSHLGSCSRSFVFLVSSRMIQGSSSCQQRAAGVMRWKYYSAGFRG